MSKSSKKMIILSNKWYTIYWKKQAFCSYTSSFDQILIVTVINKFIYWYITSAITMSLSQLLTILNNDNYSNNINI